MRYWLGIFFLSFSCSKPIIQDVIIVKDYTGSAYLPEWNYNGIGDFIYSYGYQIKLQNTVNNFQFCQTIILSE